MRTANLVGQSIEGQQLLLAGQLRHDLHRGHICMRQPICHRLVHSLDDIHKRTWACITPVC